MSIELLQGNGVIAHGSYNDANSKSDPVSTQDTVTVKIQLSKAQLQHLWWVEDWDVSTKITSTNHAGTTSTTGPYDIQEPAQPDKATISPATIKVGKTGKYTVTIGCDPSLETAIKVKLGSATLNHTDDQQIAKNGKLVWTFTLKAAALHHLKSVKHEKVTISVTLGKGPTTRTSAKATATLKAPKTS
jgi:hypothetical protein